MTKPITKTFYSVNFSEHDDSLEKVSSEKRIVTYFGKSYFQVIYQEPNNYDYGFCKPLVEFFLSHRDNEKLNGDDSNAFSLMIDNELMPHNEKGYASCLSNSPNATKYYYINGVQIDPVDYLKIVNKKHLIPFL